MTTAYVRYLGVAAGAPQLFMGPMAKQQRMALVTLACLVAAGEALAGLPGRAVPVALGLVVVGCAVTVARRLRAVARAVSAR